MTTLKHPYENHAGAENRRKASERYIDTTGKITFRDGRTIVCQCVQLEEIENA